jgi:hypothetical protein
VPAVGTVPGSCQRGVPAFASRHGTPVASGRPGHGAGWAVPGSCRASGQTAARTVWTSIPKGQAKAKRVSRVATGGAREAATATRRARPTSSSLSLGHLMWRPICDPSSASVPAHRADDFGMNRRPDVVDLRVLFFYFLSRNRSRRGQAPTPSSRARLDASGADADVRPVVGVAAWVPPRLQLPSLISAGQLPGPTPAAALQSLAIAFASTRCFRAAWQAANPATATCHLPPCKMLPVLVTNTPVTP